MNEITRNTLTFVEETESSKIYIKPVTEDKVLQLWESKIVPGTTFLDWRYTWEASRKGPRLFTVDAAAQECLPDVITLAEKLIATKPVNSRPAALPV